MQLTKLRATKPHVRLPRLTFVLDLGQHLGVHNATEGTQLLTIGLSMHQLIASAAVFVHREARDQETGVDVGPRKERVTAFNFVSSSLSHRLQQAVAQPTHCVDVSLGMKGSMCRRIRTNRLQSGSQAHLQARGLNRLG